MAKVIWAPSALDDIAPIAECSTRDTVRTASLSVRRLMEGANRLREFALSGPVTPETGGSDSRR